jgi:hypothetical protein
MTADFYPFEMSFLGATATRIKGVTGWSLTFGERTR